MRCCCNPKSSRSGNLGRQRERFYRLLLVPLLLLTAQSSFIETRRTRRSWLCRNWLMMVSLLALSFGRSRGVQGWTTTTTTLLRTTTTTTTSCLRATNTAVSPRRHRFGLLLDPCRAAAPRPHPTSSLSSASFAIGTTTTRLYATTATSRQTTQPKQHHLVIVESPAKCKTIESILNNPKEGSSNNISYTVTSCMGHIRNLPKKKSKAKSKEKKTKKDTDFPSASCRFPYSVTGIDLEHGMYEPEYVIIDNKQNIVRDLQRQVQNTDAVLLATDPDREGEAMAWHLKTVLDLGDNGDRDPKKKKQKKKKQTPYHRIRFTEITPQAIIQAVEPTLTTALLPGGDGANKTTNDNDNNNNDGSLLDINQDLVAAQETRRVLDRLAGFTVSPILWKKIAPGLSAGRVQSVGLQLVVKREQERLSFEMTPYYDITAVLFLAAAEKDDAAATPSLSARLQSINGTAVANTGKDFAKQGRVLAESSKHKIHLASEQDAQYWIDKLHEDENTIWKVDTITSRRRTTKAPRPYKTSTLQQESVRRLGLSVQTAMRTAQTLYEAGCISYMRTDSTALSQEAESTVEKEVSAQFGAHMLSDSVAVVADKFAQEAHEAIRPAIQANGQFLAPEQLPSSLSDVAVNLYRMIYQRTLAHRMPPLITNQTQVVIEGPNGDTVLHFRVSGSVVVSPGYTLAHGSLSDDVDDDSNPKLPPMVEGQVLKLKDIFPVQHETQPPPRYTEASFVKELEALGVGRPSTYAGVVQILRDRAYVGSPVGANSNARSKKRSAPVGAAISAVRAAGGEEFTGGGSARGPLVPSLSAFVVCALLEKNCPTYVDPSFTARMEARLDQIASGAVEMSGEEQRVAYLDEFYAGDTGLAAQIKRIEDSVDASVARRVILPALNLTDGKDIGLFIGPWGPYVQQLNGENDASSGDDKPPTAPLPPGMAADLSTIQPAILQTLLAAKQSGGTILGQHPDDGRNIRLKTGRFGAYLQCGDDNEEGTTTHSLPRQKASMRKIETFDGDDFGDEEPVSLGAALGITLEEAVGYVGLPRTVSTLDGLPITAAIGPYGPYLKYNNTFLSLDAKDGDVLTIDQESANSLVTDGIINKPSGLGRGVIADLGEMQGSKVTVKNGRYGKYLNWKRVNAKLPLDYMDEPGEIPLEEAWSLIQEKAGKQTVSKKKNNVDPDVPPPPKRPKTAYLHFCAEKRPEVSETVKSLGEVSKKLATLWAETGADDRRKYEEMAASSKLEYAQKKQEWEEQCKELSKGSQKRTKNASAARSRASKTKNPAPKRPKSAYLFFCAAKRPEIADKAKSLGDISKELSRLWAETTDRQEYEELAAADKQRYGLQKLETKNGTKLPKRLTKSASIKTKNGNSRTGKKESPQRAPSAYMLFCREYRPSIVDSEGEKLPFGEITKRLATMWRECDVETRARFQELAAEEKEKLLAGASK